MKMSATLRDLWYEGQWRLPKWMWRTLNVAKELSVLVFRPYLNVLRWKGETKGGPITITYAINGADSILKWYLESLMFVEEPVEEKVGRVPFWQIGSLLSSSGSDLTFISANDYLIGRLPKRNAIVLPRFVNQALDVSGEWEAVVQRLHPKLRRHELRLVRKYGYDYEVSGKDEDFKMFFRDMYLPSMKSRHGHQALLSSYAKAYRNFKRGVLFLVKRDGAPVSGGLCYIEKEVAVVHFLLVGVRQSDVQLMKEGAQGAVYYAIVHWANKHGYKRVDFQATDPYLTKGVFQHKRRWGAAVKTQSHKRIWIGIHQNTPSVNQFMKDHPCIIINEQGDLQGLFFTDEPEDVPPDTKAAWESLCAVPGLNGYRMCSVEGFLDNSHPV